ncbi:hypothetical protein PMIN06_007046 [Paraphaeosphaeria minitans]
MKPTHVFTWAALLVGAPHTTAQLVDPVTSNDTKLEARRNKLSRLTWWKGAPVETTLAKATVKCAIETGQAIEATLQSTLPTMAEALSTCSTSKSRASRTAAITTSAPAVESSMAVTLETPSRSSIAAVDKREEAASARAPALETLTQPCAASQHRISIPTQTTSTAQPADTIFVTESAGRLCPRPGPRSAMSVDHCASVGSLGRDGAAVIATWRGGEEA